MDDKKFAELGGLKNSKSANTTWSNLKKKLFPSNNDDKAVASTDMTDASSDVEERKPNSKKRVRKSTDHDNSNDFETSPPKKRARKPAADKPAADKPATDKSNKRANKAVSSSAAPATTKAAKAKEDMASLGLDDDVTAGPASANDELDEE